MCNKLIVNSIDQHQNCILLGDRARRFSSELAHQQGCSLYQMTGLLCDGSLYTFAQMLPGRTVKQVMDL